MDHCLRMKIAVQLKKIEHIVFFHSSLGEHLIYFRLIMYKLKYIK